MEKNIKFLTAAIFIAFNISSVFAQNAGDFSEDTVLCKENCAIYQLRYKNEEKTGKFTPETYNAWRNVFFTCPRASKNMYAPHGIKMFTVLAQKETDNVKKQAYIDTILMIYDRRIQYFGEESRYIGLKGADLYLLSPSSYETAYEYCRKSFDILGAKCDVKTMVICLQTSIKKFENNSMPKVEVIELYQKISDAFDVNIAKGSKAFQKQKSNIEELFLSVKPDCNDLIALFEPQFNADSTNTELLKKITDNLGKNCSDSKLYFNAAVELDKIEPSAISKRAIGDMYVATKQTSKALDYYKSSIDLEATPENNASTYYKMAQITSGSTSVSYANKALSLKPNMGAAYLIIASKYVEGINSCTGNAEFPELEKWKIYWAAYDLCQKAKATDPSIASQANSYAASFKSHFPDTETLFGYNVSEGSEQKINCWFSATTTAKIK